MRYLALLLSVTVLAAAPTSAAGWAGQPPARTAEGAESAQGSEAGAQEPADQELPSVRESLTEEEEEALRLVEEILAEQDLLLSDREFVYSSEGRRDPFRSLLEVRQRQLAAPEQRPPGLAGFLVDEVEVKAIARFQGRWTAMLLGLDRRTYMADVGTELYDGRIVEIAADRVVFEQEVEDMLGARSTRRVVKRLSPGA